MLAELTEEKAQGEIARIYAEIRETCAVPYVSSLQRHLATRPGWLEWVWGAVRPAFMTGIAQQAAWDAAEQVDAPPMSPLSHEALRVLGVDEAGERSIRAVCDNFVRASPTNLMLSGMLRMLLHGERPGGETASLPPHGAFALPPELPSLPVMLSPADLPLNQAKVLEQLATEVAGQQFVSGLYRMLAHWPGYFAHVATQLEPRFSDASTLTACSDVLRRIDEAVPSVFAQLPALNDYPAMPSSSEFADVLDALNRYRQSSPEMIVFGTIIRDALPQPARTN